MNTNTNQIAQVATKPQAAYILKQQTRKRYSFGPAWMNMVLGGIIQDRAKLVAHAVQLNVGRKYDLNKLKFDTLLAKVQNALLASVTTA